MNAELAVTQSEDLLLQLEGLLNEVQTPECRFWLAQELEGYEFSSHLPWYRIIPCQQRGYFLDLESGKYLTSVIHSQTLNQRDVARIRFIYARKPAAYYLKRHNSGIEPWPEQLLEDYREQLIPGHVCLQAWHEPVISLREQLMEGIEHFIREYPKLAANQPQQGFKALQHQHWRI